MSVFLGGGQLSWAMRIIYHLRSFPKLSESFILNEIYTLVEKGHEVAVFAFNNPGDEYVHSEFDSIDIPIRYSMPLSIRSVLAAARSLSQSWPIRQLVWNSRYALRDLAFAHQLQGFIEDLEWEPDVIHGHFASSMRTSAQLVADNLGVAHVITCHANDIYNRGNRPTARRVLSASDRVITVCESNKRFIESELGVSTPVDVVQASIRFEKFHPSTTPVDGRILTVARLTGKKGLKYGIDALASVRNTLPDVSYHIIGSGEIRDELESQIRSRELEEHISLLGHVSEQRLLQELDEAEVFILPSVIIADGDRDATPVVLKEAMAMGVPCVSTEVCGIPEVVDHGENGLIVPSRDVEGLARAIESILQDDDWRAGLASNARARAQTFDISQTIERLEESFEKTIRF